jgi:ankyrin repeat protein
MSIDNLFQVAAAASMEDHRGGGLAAAEALREQDPDVIGRSLFSACLYGDVGAVRGFLAADERRALHAGGVFGWDPLSYVCFSRYLREQAEREADFVEVARMLLDAGASPNTGWYGTIDYPVPKPMFEAVIYGAAGVAGRVGLTRLLLERGADPNDGETPYHVPENYDNAVLRLLLDSGKWNADSLATVLLRKTDTHDLDGVELALAGGADPNRMTPWHDTALLHAIRRDNRIEIVRALLDGGADAAVEGGRPVCNGAELAAWRGRGDVLDELAERGVRVLLRGPSEELGKFARGEPGALDAGVLAMLGGEWMCLFAGNDNAAGLRRLVEAGVAVDARGQGDGYFGTASGSTALHVAAWRARPSAARELIRLGADVNAKDDRGRSPLQLAVKACVDSYWMGRRTPETVKDLLAAGARREGIALPCGYAEVDALLEG